MTKTWIVLLSTWAMLGCQGELALEPEPFKTLQQEGVVSNGTNLNGTNLNGTNLNGTNLNSFRLGGLSVQSVQLVGSMFQGTSSNGVPMQGTDFVGVELDGQTSGGSVVRLRIDAATTGTGTNQDVWLYTVSYKDRPGHWSPICKDENQQAVAAVAVAGRWDYGQGVPGGGSHIAEAGTVTLGCRGAGIAKCVEIGYKPWVSLNGVSLANHHQACTRMMRADFCGNGQPYTREGTLINVYDSLGVQQDTQNWIFESEWGTHGARCMGVYNRAKLQLPCYLENLLTDCALIPSFQGGTLLMTETPVL
jgi:hypothetical protein